MAWEVDNLPIGPGLVKRNGRLDVNLADPRRTDPSLTVPAAHGYTHGASGGDPVTIAMTQVTGLAAELADKVDDTDTRLTDARTPTAHASTHADGGSDEITIAMSQVTGLAAALAAFTALPAWTDADIGKSLTITPGGLAWIDAGATVPLTYDGPNDYDTADTYDEEWF